MKIPASLSEHKNLIGIGAAVLSVAAFGAVAFAVYQNQGTAPEPAVIAQPVATPEPTVAPTESAPVGKNMLKKIVGDALNTSATYLGLAPQDLMTQLKSGNSLADAANATPGKSRDGLVAALTAAADTNIDAAVRNGTLTADQVGMAKKRLPNAIGKLVDHPGAPRK